MANYLKYINEESTIYEDEYVDGSDVEITFPSQKRNLIYIFFGIDGDDLCRYVCWGSNGCKLYSGTYNTITRK